MAPTAAKTTCCRAGFSLQPIYGIPQRAEAHATNRNSMHQPLITVSVGERFGDLWSTAVSDV